MGERWSEEGREQVTFATQRGIAWGTESKRGGGGLARYGGSGGGGSDITDWCPAVCHTRDTCGRWRRKESGRGKGKGEKRGVGVERR